MKKIHQRVVSFACILAGFGFGLYLSLVTFMRLRINQTTEVISEIEKLTVSVLLLISLILIVGSTVMLVKGLWPSPAKGRLTSGQKLIRYYALGSLVVAVVALFVPWLAVVTLALGVTALGCSYSKENRPAQDIRVYRIVCFIAMMASILNNVLIVV